MNRNRTGAGPGVDGPCIQMWMWQRGGVDTQIGRRMVGWFFFGPACCLKTPFFVSWLVEKWVEMGGNRYQEFQCFNCDKKT